MATSKIPVTFLKVPSGIAKLSRNLKGTVVCNKRPEQRRPSSKPNEWQRHPAHHEGGEYVDDPFERFLCGVVRPTTIALLYQDFGPRLFTAIVNLLPIKLWADDGLPRLEFDSKLRPDEMFPTMWGSFVLAVSQVSGVEHACEKSDPGGELFSELVRQHGIQTKLPDFRSGVVLPIPFTAVTSFHNGLPVHISASRHWRLIAGDQARYRVQDSFQGIARILSVEDEACDVAKLTDSLAC